MSIETAFTQRNHVGHCVDPELVGSAIGYRTFIDRARELVSLLAANAEMAEQMGRTPPVLIDAILESGIFRILRPARFSGYAQRPELLFDVCAVLAEVCM